MPVGTEALEWQIWDRFSAMLPGLTEKIQTRRKSRSEDEDFAKKKKKIKHGNGN